MIAIEMLDGRSAASCLHLTLPSCRSVLLSCSPAGPVLAACYKILGTPLGLILWCIDEDGADAYLLSLLVAGAHRNQGIGTALVQRMELELTARGCRHIHAHYAVDGQNTIVLERLFRKFGWQLPTASHIECRIVGSDFQRMVQAPWVAGSYLPPAFSIFPWYKATQEELDALRRRPADTPVYRTRFDPFSGNETFEPLNSIGVRYNGEIVGWMLTQKLGPPGLLLYDRLYIAPPFQTMGRAVAVLAESLKRHYQAEGHIHGMGACFRTSLDNQAMLRFVRRRMGQFLTSQVEVRACSKLLKA